LVANAEVLPMRPLPTLRQLRYLVALAEHRHFGRAADECLVTQSTLSAGIRELEDVLGVTLVGRSKRHVALTPLGEDIVARAQALLRGAEELVDAAQVGSRPLTGLLRLGVIPTIGPYLLPRALPTLRAAYPQLRLYLREEQTARLLDMLGRGRLDAGLIALPYLTGELQTMPLAEDRLLVACPRGHHFSGLTHVDAGDLAGERLLLLEDGHCLRNHALTACRLLPGQANEDLQATSLSTLVQMVGSSLGLTLIPELAVAFETRREPNVVVVPFAALPPVREIALVWRPESPRSRDLRLLGDILRAELRSAGGQGQGGDAEDGGRPAAVRS
jgi:LysR family hydrogen peroxide-inducible transcriptional activator